MNTTDIENLLKNVSDSVRNHKEKIQKSGIDFNLISILEMENNERYTHSAFIAELLNPEGRHGLGDSFLILFMEMFQIKIVGFEPSRVEVFKEKYIGKKLGLGTFLDIVLWDKTSGKKILIENKIFALDQEMQLERYVEYKPDVLIYLTPDGKPYKNEIDNLKCLSYEKDIIKWLKACILKTKETNPKHALAIEMYLDTVKKITNQTIYIKMKDDIKKAILEKEENFEAAKEICQNFYKIVNEVEIDFFNILQREFGNDKIVDFKDCKIECSLNYESSEIFLGFKLQDDCNNTSQEEIRSHIRNSFFDINLETGYNEYWLLWFYPSDIPKGKISTLSPKAIVDIYKNMEDYARVTSKDFNSVMESILKS